MNYDFDSLIERKGSGCFKHDALGMMFGKTDIIPLWVADMDFATAPEILEAMQARLNHKVFGYNLRPGSFYEAIANWMQSRFNWEVHRQAMVCSPSIVAAIKMAIMSLTNANDKIMIQTPVYRPFHLAVSSSDRELITNRLINTNGLYSIDFDAFEKQVSTCKMFILCSPHNPVGRVWTYEELQKMGEICRRHGVIVVSDEIHADLVYDPYRHIPISALEDFGDFCITCISAAKSFNLAGLSTAVSIIPNQLLRDPVATLNADLALYMGNSFGIVALEAAYSKGDLWLAALMDYLKQNRDLLMDFFAINLPQLKISPIEGTYLAWIDCRALKLDDEGLKDFFVHNAGLALESGTVFGEDGSGFMRWNFGCPRSVLIEACDRLHYSISTL